MLYQSQKLQGLLLGLILISTLSLSACAGQVQAKKLSEPEVILIPETEEKVQPAEDQEASSDQEISIVSHEEARDIAVAYLVEKFALAAPVEWFSQDQIPEGVLGASNFLYTSGGWVVGVQAPVVAPEYLVYSIKIDNIAVGLHWEGQVDAWGNLQESAISGPLEVLSAEEARDAAVAFIVETYNWDIPGDWVEQAMKPIENAGVRQTYTSGAWVVVVDHYAAAPIVPSYHVIADHMSLITRWEGRISAAGEIVEEAYVSE